MQFRTTIDVKPFEHKIDHRSRILSLGSCFATRVAEQLAHAKFSVTSSPTGILFNPESIASAIDRFDAVARGDWGAMPAAEDLMHDNGRWFSFDFHSDFSHSAADVALQRMREGVERGAEALSQADTLIITFGTAFVYRSRQTGEVVANCHKQPQALFEREMLSAEQIAARYTALLQGPLRDKRVIFTLSPVRHLGDGLEQNSLSKATLRVAIGQITEQSANATYFPSYEILMDELRDYRFYADDMMHPSAVAVEYILKRFREAAFTEPTLSLTSQIEQITRAAAHRPFDTEGEKHKQFCHRMMERIEQLQSQHPQLDFEEEKAAFGRYL